MIVAVSLVAAGVMTYLMFSRIGRGFLSFSLGAICWLWNDVLACQRGFEISQRCEKKEFEE